MKIHFIADLMNYNYNSLITALPPRESGSTRRERDSGAVAVPRLD